jgi:hypothetical protein
LSSAEVFDSSCSVGLTDGDVDCRHRPGLACHVKDATVLFRRMGDMGKLPTSAWLHVGRAGGLGRMVEEVVEVVDDPSTRADRLVEKIASVYRVGRKLATMFVSALSVPALAPGLTPWFSEIDGTNLVVVDTHVARAIETLTGGRAGASYEARARWVRRQARDLDLQQFRSDVPRFSARLVQQALYAFCSKSNRVARGDECSLRSCSSCVSKLCPFLARSEPGRAVHRLRP